jgi:hypothetical protein
MAMWTQISDVGRLSSSEGSGQSSSIEGGNNTMTTGSGVPGGRQRHAQQAPDRQPSTGSTVGPRQPNNDPGSGAVNGVAGTRTMGRAPFTGGERVDRIQWRKVWIRRPAVKGELEVVPAMGSPDLMQPATGGSDLEPLAMMNRSLQHEAGTDGGGGCQGRRLRAHEDGDLKLLARRQQ